MYDHKLEIVLAAKDITQQAFSSVQGHIQRLDKAVFSLRGAFVAAAGVAGMGYFVKSQLEVADSIAKTADKLGLGTGALQEYRFGAKQSGVEQATLDMALQRFTRRVGEAAQGTGELKGTLEKYNIEVKDANGNIRSTDDVLADLADTIQNAETDSERLRIAFKAFDSEGAALVNMLREGSKGLAEFRQEARDLGLVIDDRLIRESEKANDELEKMGRVLSVQVTSAVVELAPYITEVAQYTTDWVKANNDLIEQKVEATIGAIRDSVKGLADTYTALPEGVVGAAGVGLVWSILFGIWPAGAMAGAIYYIVTHLADLEESLRRISKMEEAQYIPFPLITALKQSKELADKITAAMAKWREAPPVLGIPQDDTAAIAEDLAEVGETAGTAAKAVATLQEEIATGWETTELERLQAALHGEAEQLKFMAKLREDLRREDSERLQEAMDEQDRYIEEGLNGYIGAADETIRIAKETADEYTFIWRHAFENIQDSLADMIYEWEFSMDSVLDIFKRMLSEMTAAAAMQNIILPVTSPILADLGFGLTGGATAAGAEILSGLGGIGYGLEAGYGGAGVTGALTGAGTAAYGALAAMGPMGWLGLGGLALFSGSKLMGGETEYMMSPAAGPKQWTPAEGYRPSSAEDTRMQELRNTLFAAVNSEVNTILTELPATAAAAVEEALAANPVEQAWESGWAEDVGSLYAQYAQVMTGRLVETVNTAMTQGLTSALKEYEGAIDLDKVTARIEALMTQGGDVAGYYTAITDLVRGLKEITEPAGALTTQLDELTDKYQEQFRAAKALGVNLGLVSKAISREGQGIVDAYLAPFTSLRESMTAWSEERGQRGWGLEDYSAHFQDLTLALASLDETASDYYEKSLFLLEAQFSVLKDIDRLEKDALSKGAYQAETALGAIDRMIASMSGVGQFTAVTSREAYQLQYETLLTGAKAGEPEAVSALESFLPDYLDFMRQFGGDYAGLTGEIIDELSGISVQIEDAWGDALKKIAENTGSLLTVDFARDATLGGTLDVSTAIDNVDFATEGVSGAGGLTGIMARLDNQLMAMREIAERQAREKILEATIPSGHPFWEGIDLADYIDTSNLPSYMVGPEGEPGWHPKREWVLADPLNDRDLKGFSAYVEGLLGSYNTWMDEIRDMLAKLADQGAPSPPPGPSASQVDWSLFWGGTDNLPYQYGGIAEGPETGYPATLHGIEAVVPLPGDRAIPVKWVGPGPAAADPDEMGRAMAGYLAPLLFEVIRSSGRDQPIIINIGGERFAHVMARENRNSPEVIKSIDARVRKYM